MPSSTVSRWENRCAKTVIVGMLSMRCAVMGAAGCYRTSRGGVHSADV